MKYRFISWTLLLLLLTVVPSFAAQGGPGLLLPAPARVIPGAGTTLYREPAVLIGGKAFRKATAQLPAFAQEEAYRITLSRKRIRIEANTETVLRPAEPGPDAPLQRHP